MENSKFKAFVKKKQSRHYWRRSSNLAVGVGYIYMKGFIKVLQTQCFKAQLNGLIKLSITYTLGNCGINGRKHIQNR